MDCNNIYQPMLRDQGNLMVVPKSKANTRADFQLSHLRDRLDSKSRASIVALHSKNSYIAIRRKDLGFHTALNSARSSHHQ